MNGAFVVLIIGATVSISMYFAYLSQRSKERADIAMSGRGGVDGDGPSREEFEALNQQMAELAERVDFAERMLAQRRDPQRLGASGEQDRP